MMSFFCGSSTTPTISREWPWCWRKSGGLKDDDDTDDEEEDDEDEEEDEEEEDAADAHSAAKDRAC